jgi:hypothetical protein
MKSRDLSASLARCLGGWERHGVDRTTGRAWFHSRLSLFHFSFGAGIGVLLWLRNWAGNDAYSQRASNTDTSFKQGWEGAERLNSAFVPGITTYRCVHRAPRVDSRSCPACLLPVELHFGSRMIYPALSG